MPSTDFADPSRLLHEFRAGFDEENGFNVIASGLIGKDIILDGPFGARLLLYADYVASGRALQPIEDFLLHKVLPYYANTHSLDSFCGTYSTSLRNEARSSIAKLCGADNQYAVIFAGAGATAGLNRLVSLLGASGEAHKKDGRSKLVASLFRRKTTPPALVIIGPYEHHSNILPWRESGADVVEIGELPVGGPDLDQLRNALSRSHLYEKTICAFSAASNVTGLMADVPAITKIVKQAGALMVWDYAAAGPYLPIVMRPSPGIEIDAVVISPHKFIGGPGASGILIIRRDAAVTTRPVMPGGGTVTFVSSTAHDYIDLLEEREEAGTPNYMGDVRAALAFLVKDVVAQGEFTRRNAELVKRALTAWRDVDGLEILGPLDSPRLPIFSFLIRDQRGGYVNPHFVSRILSDAFGIQARGGCACAGPYAHRLLNIGPARSRALRQEILAGIYKNKPGFTRLNLSPFMPEDKVRFIIDTIAGLPETIAALSEHYVFDQGADAFHVRPQTTPTK